MLCLRLPCLTASFVHRYGTVYWCDIFVRQPNESTAAQDQLQKGGKAPKEWWGAKTTCKGPLAVSMQSWSPAQQFYLPSSSACTRWMPQKCSLLW